MAMKTSASLPGLSLSVEREVEEITTLDAIKVPDPDWRYVDTNGHGHFWDGEQLPTLDWVTTGKGYYPDNTSYDIGEWRCKQCGSVVEPVKKSMMPMPVFGPPVYTVVFHNDAPWLSGQRQHRLSQAQWDGAVAAMREWILEELGEVG